MMKKQEKEMMISLYKEQFNYFLLSGEQSESEKLRLNGMKQMLVLFLTKQEIATIENKLRITKEYKQSYFESVESWQRQIEKEIGEKAFPFSWTVEGIEQVKSAYDWVYETYKEYKGMKSAIEYAYSSLT
jgi:hypothetical protein